MTEKEKELVLGIVPPVCLVVGSGLGVYFHNYWLFLTPLTLLLVGGFIFNPHAGCTGCNEYHFERKYGWIFGTLAWPCVFLSFTQPLLFIPTIILMFLGVIVSSCNKDLWLPGRG